MLQRLRLSRLLFALAVAIALVYVLLALFQAYTTLQPARSDVSSAGLLVPYEAIRFSSRDGVVLSGWYISSRNGGAVILTHGYFNNRSQLIDHANALAEAGYGVLLYDMRGHGESGGDRPTFGWLEVSDLLGALDYVQGRADVDPQRIGVYGFSVGGQVTLRAAALTPDIHAVVVDGVSTAIFTDNPPPANLVDWLYMPESWLYHQFIGLFTGLPQPDGVVESVSNIAPRPILMIATSSNREFRQVRRFCEIAGSNCTFWNIPETGHGGGWKARPVEYARRLVEFYDAALTVGKD